MTITRTVGLWVGIGALLGATACKDEKKTDADASADANADAMTVAIGDAAVSAPSIPSSDASGGVDGGVFVEPDAASAPELDAATAATAAKPREAGSGGLETAAGDDAGAKKPGRLSLDESSDGKTFDVAPGQTIVVMLSASPTSGFDWAVIKAPPALGAPDLGFVSGGDAMGAVGKRRLTFTVKTALPAGEHAVELGYRRSFEQGVPPFKTFKFKVRGR
jgi:predicted secreted protein